MRLLTVALALACVGSGCAQEADLAAGEAALIDLVRALPQQYEVQVVAWLGADPNTPVQWNAEATLQDTLKEVLWAAPGAYEVRDQVVVLSLPPPWHPVEGVRLPSDLAAMRATLERFPDEVMTRMVAGERVSSETLPERTKQALRHLIEARYWNDTLGPGYLRAIEEGRIGLKFDPLLTILDPEMGLAPGDWQGFLRKEGEDALLTADWSRWADWPALPLPVELAVELPTDLVGIEPGVYSLDEVVLALSEATDTVFEAGRDCAGNRIYLAAEPMPAADLVGLVAEACCLSVWRDGETVQVGNAIPHDHVRRLHRRNLTSLLGMLGPLTVVPADSEAGRFAAWFGASPTVRLSDLPDDLDAIVWERCWSRVGPEAELRLIPGFSLCLYAGGRSQLLFF